jgi:hypothetical protein
VGYAKAARAFPCNGTVIGSVASGKPTTELAAPAKQARDHGFALRTAPKATVSKLSRLSAADDALQRSRGVGGAAGVVCCSVHIDSLGELTCSACQALEIAFSPQRAQASFRNRLGGWISKACQGQGPVWIILMVERDSEHRGPYRPV